MRIVLAAVALVCAPGIALGAELQCTSIYNGRIIDTATFMMDGDTLTATIGTVNPVDREGPLLDRALDIEFHSVEHTNGINGPLQSVALARQTSPSPAGEAEFSPIVYFIDWGHSKARYVYTIGGGEVANVAYDSCQRQD